MHRGYSFAIDSTCVFTDVPLKATKYKSDIPPPHCHFMSPLKRNPVNIRINLLLPETELLELTHVKMFVVIMALKREMLMDMVRG